MVSTYTTNKGYDKQGTGDNPGAWGPPLNANFDIIDNNLGGTLSLSLSSSNVTLSSSQAQNLNYVLTGTLSASVEIIWPAVGGIYNIFNNTTGNFSVTLKNLGGTATVVAPQGYKLTVWSDGTNTYNFDAVAGSLRVPGNLVVVGTTTFTTSISFTPPGGRLTLSSGTPVMTSDVTGATTVYYEPYLNGFASFYDGTTWNQKSFSALSQTLSDNTKSPAATVADSNYDYFLWDDSGTIRCTRGPAWSSSTTRGSGAGTTEITRVTNGVWVNTNLIVNGPAAGRGLYVGSIRTNSSNQVDYMPSPSAAAGGSNNRLYVWNMYNRLSVAPICRDSENQWSYSTSTWRPANGAAGNVNNRISYICGLAEDAINASYQGYTSGNTSNRNGYAGVAFTSITTPTGTFGYYIALNNDTPYPIRAEGVSYPTLGLGYVQAMEYAQNATTTFYGDANTPTIVQNALIMNWRM